MQIGIEQEKNWTRYLCKFFCNILSSFGFLWSPKCTFETHIVSTFSSSDILYLNFLYYKLFMLVLHDAKPFWRVLHTGSESHSDAPVDRPRTMIMVKSHPQLMPFRAIFWSDVYSLIRENSHWWASEHRTGDWFFPLQNSLCFKSSITRLDYFQYKFVLLIF